MATFNVFVEGAVGSSPTALSELADAMSQRYGLQAKDLVSRLQRGRFRVKSNVDAATAERYKRDLEKIGAKVLLEDSAISPTATPVAGTPVVRMPSNVSLPPLNERKPSTMSTPPSGLSAAGPQQPRASTPIPVSGLSAAFGDATAQDLGALGGSSLSLASLDGEEAPASSNQFEVEKSPEPPPKPVVTMKKPTAPPENKPKAKPAAASEPLDMFAPPDAGDQNFVVDLANDELAERAAKRASTPLPVADPTPLPQTRKTPLPMPAVAPSEVVTRPAQFSRAHFIAGIVVALVIGFLPAHFLASMREKSAFRAIDGQATAAYAAVDSYDAWVALDATRDKLLDEKESKRQMIALTSMLIWAVVSAAASVAFFRFAKPKT